MKLPRFPGTITALAALLSVAISFGAEPEKKEDPARIEFEFRIVQIPDAIAAKLPVLNLQQPAQEKGGRLKFGVPANVIGVQRYEQLLQAMEASDAAKLIAAPRITTRPKVKATVEKAREIRYPTEWAAPAEPNGKWTPKAFDTRKLGLTLEAQAEVNEDKTLNLEVTVRAVALLGFTDRTTKNPLLDWKPEPAEAALGWADEAPVNLRDLALPVFEVQQAATKVKMHAGQTALLILAPTEETAPYPSPYAGQTLLALVTARRPAAERIVEKAPPPPPAEGGPPFAIPVGGKPGFVRSPYAPDAGFIDVRGFAPGTEVRDPYGSGNRIFRVP